MDHIKFWEKQYRRNIDRVIGVCYLYTGDRSVAEDLAQDVFVKAMDKFRSIRAVLAFDPNRPPRPCRLASLRAAPRHPVRDRGGTRL